MVEILGKSLNLYGDIFVELESWEAMLKSLDEFLEDKQSRLI